MLVMISAEDLIHSGLSFHLLRNHNHKLIGLKRLYLRQRNTYQGNPPTPFLKPPGNLSGPVGSLTSLDQTSSFLPQETGSRVLEIVETSRLKAQTMVDAAVQAMSSIIL
ncbi:hypothetical protein ACHQM5_026506 [Ranunculus cassubicifolius]